MVLSLPIPSFKSTTTAPLRSTDSNSSSSSRHIWKPSITHSTTLSEALRNNPFGITRSRPEHTTAQDLVGQRKEQDELNASLETLAVLFPDIRIEVFRELLVRFDGGSRLQVCVDQLLRYKKEWVGGRWNTTPDGDGGEDGSGSPDQKEGEGKVPVDERFRSPEYKTAVKGVLVREFGGLSKSTVEAVLAEVNFSYGRARPTLRDLSRRTWRATIGGLLPSFKRKRDRERGEEHPLMVWRVVDGEMVPRLKETGCEELDRELYGLLLEPVLRVRREGQVGRDFLVAEELNAAQAKEADALYECECCLMDVTFEQIATCSADSHVICYGCIQRTVQEALFGQGWAKSVDTEKATLRCLAPMTYGNCEGSLHPEIVKQAMLLEKSGQESYRKFEDRLASDALLKSQLKLIRCPFCSYAEADPVYHPSSRGITWRFRRDGILPTLVTVFFLLDLIPVLIVAILILLCLNPSTIPRTLDTSFLNLCLKIRTKRFTCSNPTCRRTSCVTCQKPWRDPHICHEPLLLDLRATVESARTAAVKRTCPRCGLSFIKSSGCNKLTCICGYSMCYLCRKALGQPLPHQRQPRLRPQPRRRPAAGAFFNQENINIMNIPLHVDADAYPEDLAPAEEDEGEEPESYNHFCEHFRLNPGSSCTECTKCDLYAAEDEEVVARKAGERAELEWRARQGQIHGQRQGQEWGSGSPPVVTTNVNRNFSRGGLGSILVEMATYWGRDVWKGDRWKGEGQRVVDALVERVVDVVEI